MSRMMPECKADPTLIIGYLRHVAATLTSVGLISISWLETSISGKVLSAPKLLTIGLTATPCPLSIWNCAIAVALLLRNKALSDHLRQLFHLVRQLVEICSRYVARIALLIR